MNKLTKSFFGLFLGAAFSLGVAASINANKNSRVDEAKAYTGHQFYVVPNNKAYSIKVWVNRGWNEELTWDFTNTGHTYHGYPIYSGSIWDHDDQGHFNYLRIQMYDGSTWKSECKYIDGPWTVFDGDGKMFVFSDDSEGSFITYSEDSYRVKCGSGNFTNLPFDDGGGLPSGTVGQYIATLDVTAGSSLTFESYNGAWSETLSPSYSGDTNNYYNGAVSVSTNSATIYLKYNSDATYDAWVTGYTACTVIVGGIEYITNISGEGSSAKYTTNIAYADKTQRVQVSWNHIAIETYLNGDSTAGCFSGSDGTVTCSLTGAYTIQVHNNGYGQHNTVYIVRDDSATASYLAQKFNSIVGGTCHSDGSTRTSDLKTAWDNAAGHFTGQPTDVINKFVKNSSDSDIRIMMGTTGVDGKYQYVIHKYGTGVASDFLGTGDTKQAHSFMPLAMISNDNSILIIVVIASLGMLTAGAYFFFKKSRKSEE